MNEQEQKERGRAGVFKNSYKLVTGIFIQFFLSNCSKVDLQMNGRTNVRGKQILPQIITQKQKINLKHIKKRNEYNLKP